MLSEFATYANTIEAFGTLNSITTQPRVYLDWHLHIDLYPLSLSAIQLICHRVRVIE